MAAETDPAVPTDVPADVPAESPALVEQTEQVPSADPAPQEPAEPVAVNEIDTTPAAPQTAVEAVTEPEPQKPAPPAQFMTPEPELMSAVWSVSLPFNQTREIVSDVPISKADAIKLYAAAMGIQCDADGKPLTMHTFSANPID